MESIPNIPPTVQGVDGQPIVLGTLIGGGPATASAPERCPSRSAAPDAGGHGHPLNGESAITRWLDLFDRADDLMHATRLDQPDGQRRASRAIDSLFLFEHQMTPHARRLARERLWLRDYSHRPMPESDERQEWERCRCRNCLVERALGRPSIAASLPHPHLEPPMLRAS